MFIAFLEEYKALVDFACLISCRKEETLLVKRNYKKINEQALLRTGFAI